MRLTYLYVVVDDFAPALAFYRDELGLDEAWREGEGTVAFALPGSDVQIMVDKRLDDGAQWSTGPMYQVDDLDAWVREHPGVPALAPEIAAPDARIRAFRDPGGNVFHLLQVTGDAT
ncbi:Glyoxalase/bleomycin resistance protein/dioxygenase [Beutenbergia cavernae DSM 12333]|uniref:Glyoxalase/bleomycin resistance protein/dioxygenase n=1 Tax=Beutenbergia cavernae (strain ATCC BAA-8 / DSM 12333 / CCUG 43141 / JCM 11478 / NBRC 16432 / NCIMB 13614 / HKI 0122) TaxID=471853 RepID=C5BY23_BEUC1|nr:VOC family protein [Beutenbergia cavernae]ACQ78917.1 Glyoxalase/bleomycin resistance protein/dioxygenase [Beutenbergia cavernae DSM 12333]